MSIRVLTGITTSGTPHLGNYVGAIRPAIRAAGAPGTESFYFLADLHSLIKVQDPEYAAFDAGDCGDLAGVWSGSGKGVVVSAE